MPSVEFGYSSFERLAQGSKRRDELLEYYTREVTRDKTLKVENPRAEFLGSDVKREKARFVRALAPLVLAGLGALSAAAVCASEKSGEEQDSQTQVPAGGEVAGAKVEAAGQVEPFLRYPLPRDDTERGGIKVVQGWIYQGYKDGQTHAGVDYIDGSDINSASTWNRFPVMAAASGVSCQRVVNVDADNDGSQDDKLYLVEIRHPNGFKTRYLHLDARSLELRARKFPDCTLSDTQWLSIEVGEKIADAGDSGTQLGWIHLHFEVIDPRGRAVDPYDLYARRIVYPYPNFFLTPDRVCGEQSLFFEEICPRTFTLGSRVTARPSNTLTPQVSVTPKESDQLDEIFDPRIRERIIAEKSLEAQRLARTFIELLLSGDDASLAQAYAMEIPENLKSSRLSDYELGNFDAAYTPFNQIEICSRQMDLGEFQIYSFSQFRTSAQANLTQTQILNIQRGFAARDRYWVGVDFTFRRYDTSLGRLGFGDYRALYNDTYLIFEDVGGRLYIAKNLLCFNSPIIYKVAQDPWRD